MDTRREFLKKAALLTGATGFWNTLPASIATALAIDPEPGSTYLDAEHIVILMQENRSFDHAFGSLQGVRGFNDPRAVVLPNKSPVWLQTNAAGETYVPFRLNIKDTKATWMGSLPHSWTNQVDAGNHGRHDKWLDAKPSGHKDYAKIPLTMGYYNREDIPFYYKEDILKEDVMRLSRPFRIAIFCLFLWLVAGRLSIAQDSSTAAFTLTILHTNDLHGHIFPFAYTETGRSKAEMASVGGAARRATLIRRLRQEIKNPILLVDSGDTFTRGPLTNAYEGIADTEAMNAVGYDLAALGNNEFKAKDGVEDHDAQGAQGALLQVVKHSRFHWLCANATDSKGAFLEGVLPYAVREINGVRVGFLGLTTPRVATYPQAVGWTISDPIAVAKEWIPRARQHCDILIALTHIGVDLDKQLAAQTTGLDAIVGGDSHTFLYKAEEVTNLEGKKLPIVQDGEFGVNLGRFDLHFSHTAGGHWTLAGYDYQLLPVGATIKEAPDVVAELQPYLRPMLTVVGHLDKIGATPPERNEVTNRIIADALRQQAGADYALNPGDSGFEVFRHKEVTRYDVYAIMPFKNHLVTATVTGAQIEAMQKAVATTVASGDMAHLDPNRTYKVAFVDYPAKSAYHLSRAQIVDTGRDVRDVVIAYLSQKSARALTQFTITSQSVHTLSGTTPFSDTLVERLTRTLLEAARPHLALQKEQSRPDVVIETTIEDETHLVVRAQ